MVVCNSFDIYMFILSRTARSCQYLINSAFLSFFWGCQTSALIPILKTPSGSISFNSWLRCYRCYKFPTESNSERVLKIGQYLVKLWARVWCLVFFDSRCRCIFKSPKAPNAFGGRAPPGLAGRAQALPQTP